MKRFYLFILILGALVPSLWADTTTGLFDCYRLALKRSEDLQIQEELIRQTEAEFQQVFSGVLPRVTYVFKETTEQGLGTSPERKLLVTQPLFRGFKEFATMRAAKALKNQKEYEKKRSEQLLFLDVSDAFYQLLELEKDLKILSQLQRVHQKRILELNQWVRIGRSRPSELAMARLAWKQTLAEIAKTRRLLSASRQVMAFLTGVSDLRLSEEQWEWDSKEALEGFLDGFAQRPDILAKEKQREAAKENITIERADLFPSVSFEGNSYQKRTGSKAKVDWDTLFTVNIPIFEGGQQWGELKESQSLYHQAELEEKEIKRKAESDIRSEYEQFRLSLKEQQALQQAEKAADKNYELQEQDYRFQLVNQLTVLTALEQWRQTERELNHALFQTKRNFWNLKIASNQTGYDSI